MVWAPWCWLPQWRLPRRLTPLPLPFAPSHTDVREWKLEVLPPSFSPPRPFPKTGMLSVSLHRILVEAGLALTLAESAWDPRAWFALYRYGGDFAGTAPGLRFYDGVSAKDPRLTAVAAEEVATGITCYLLREYFELTHIADVQSAIANGELAYVDPKIRKRPDYFCQGADGLAVIAESKGAVGTRGPVSREVSTNGWSQVQNVVPVNLQLRPECGRVVIGTHFCVQGEHSRSETTTLVKDPKGVESEARQPESDVLLRHAYAKALRFMGQDVFAERLLAKRDFMDLTRTLSDQGLPAIGGLPMLPLGLTPFGDVIGLYGPTAEALATGARALQRPISESLRGLRQRDRALEKRGYVLPNGVMVVHDPDDLV